jgi:hypothetical protein
MAKGMERFREFLLRDQSKLSRSGPLSSRAAGNYVSRCNRVQKMLGAPLDRLLDNEGLETICEVLTRSGEGSRGSMSDCQTAVRRYAEFKAAES